MAKHALRIVGDTDVEKAQAVATYLVVNVAVFSQRKIHLEKSKPNDPPLPIRAQKVEGRAVFKRNDVQAAIDWAKAALLAGYEVRCGTRKDHPHGSYDINTNVSDATELDRPHYLQVLRQRGVKFQWP